MDDSQLVKVPENGPLIIASNHVNFIDVPLMYTHLQPRQVTGFVKAETWQNPAMAFLFDLWGAIPIQRGEADTTAFKSALQALNEGKILAIAPEGTRSGHGKLARGHAGIVLLAYYSRAPVLPLAYFGGEHLRDNLNRLKRTDFNIRVGSTFRLKFTGGKPDQLTRLAMVNEIMYQVSQLLPVEYRGYYSDLAKLTTNYLDFV